MKSFGLVMMNDDTVGVFDLDDNEKITVHLHKGSGTLKETLEFATENGIPLSLVLTPRLAED